MAKWTLNIIDSLYPEKDFNIHGLSSPCYEPIWQGVRLGLSFKGYESVRRSVTICQAYLERAVEPLEYTRRLIRVRNLLNAIPVYDWRQKPASVDIIQTATMGIEVLISQTDHIVEWDWNTARTQAPYMYRNSYSMFHIMHKDLKERTGRRQSPKRALHYFLAILNEVIDANST